jgi:DNA-directed RNA polymerase subunit RPC12/RpoP
MKIGTTMRKMLCSECKEQIGYFKDIILEGNIVRDHYFCNDCGDKRV